MSDLATALLFTAIGLLVGIKLTAWAVISAARIFLSWIHKAL